MNLEPENPDTDREFSVDGNRASGPVGGDQRLDELLSLATPKLDTAQQLRLRNFVIAELGNSAVAKTGRWQAWVAGGVAAAAVLLLIGLSVSRLNDQSAAVLTVPATAKTDLKMEPAGNPNDASESAVVANDSTFVLSKFSPSVKLKAKKKQPLPPIITRVVVNTDHRSANRDSGKRAALALSKFRQQVWLQLQPVVDSWIVSLAESPLMLAELERIAEHLPLKTQQSVETFLLQQIRSMDGRLATASFRLLCRCGTARSLPILMQQAKHLQLRSDVFVAFLRTADSESLAEQASLISLADQPAFLQPIMTRLLERGDTLSVDLFLQLVIKHRWNQVAQSCGRAARGPAIDSLLNRLNSNRMSVSRAAAVTLSTSPDPAITIELIRVCESPRYRQSAWLALTIRNDDLAKAFVTAAAQDVRRVASVMSAKRQWEQVAVN